MRILACGAWDPLHRGHVSLFQRAKMDYPHSSLFVMCPDSSIIELYKGRRELIPFKDRLAILDSIRYVDKVVPVHHGLLVSNGDRSIPTSADILAILIEKYEIDCIILDSAHGFLLTLFQHKGIKVVTFPRHPGVSSSEIYANLQSKGDIE